MNNLPPTLSLSPQANVVQQAETVDVHLLFGDPGLDDVTTNINWGDGTSDSISGGRLNPPTVLHHAGPPATYVTAVDRQRWRGITNGRHPRPRRRRPP